MTPEKSKKPFTSYQHSDLAQMITRISAQLRDLGARCSTDSTQSLVKLSINFLEICHDLAMLLSDGNKPSKLRLGAFIVTHTPKLLRISKQAMLFEQFNTINEYGVFELAFLVIKSLQGLPKDIFSLFPFLDLEYVLKLFPKSATRDLTLVPTADSSIAYEYCAFVCMVYHVTEEEGDVTSWMVEPVKCCKFEMNRQY